MIDLEITIKALGKDRWEVRTDVGGNTLVRDFRFFHEAQTYVLGLRDCAAAPTPSNTEGQ